MTERKYILPKAESEFVEFKSTFNVSVIESLVAFANTKGGTVYVGVSDKGLVKGVEIAAESVQNWVNEIKNKTEPSLVPDIDILEIDSKKVIAVRIPEYPVKPISIQGRYYKRTANSNHLMTAAAVSDCYLQVMQYSWDAYINADATLDDLDAKRIDNFINRINEKGRINLVGSNLDKLRKIQLIKNDLPTNAAMLLFAKEPLMCDIHAGRLKTAEMILDDKIIRNTLFEAVEETMRYIIGHLKVAYEITSQSVRTTTQRTEIFEYPLDAIREVVMNSIIHRKYNNPIDIQIKIFDNRITIFNPGGLYGDITIDDLKTDDYQSSARNKLIVEAFYLTGDIEKYGTGYRRIRKAISDYPTMKFDYKEMQGGYLVEFSYDEQKKDETINNKQVKVVEKVVEKVNNNQRKILFFIKDNPSITASELSKEIDISIRKIQENISKLKSLGLLVRIGPDKGGHWEVRNW